VASLDELCVNTIRALAVDSVERANSGHPGAPMGLAPSAYVLWTRHLRHNPANPKWPDRDRFVLSCGHASALLYSLLHLTGYELELEDLKGFRQWGSRTPGHPEYGVTPGVETTTGPLGQGFANAVGMAVAEELLAARFNGVSDAIVDHHTWGICSDGDLMEGISHEAASLAGHLRLGKLNFIYDDNRISIDGSTDLSCSDDVAKRFEAYGWHTTRVTNGTDLDAIDAALVEARAQVDRPSLILVRTHIAQGAPTKQDSAGSHGSPLGEAEIKAWRESIGWPNEDFHIPTEALAVFREAVERGKATEAEWRTGFEAWAAAEPELAREWERRMACRVPDLDAVLPAIEGEKLATRKAAVKTLAALAPAVPELIGGSADLTESNGTALGDEAAFAPGAPGRYIHYGIREHAMAATMNGMVLHGGLRPYGGTFLIFSDYMRNSVRLAALMEIPTIFIYSHDSIALGEDGPTHQPVEQLASLRAIPGLTVIRPADANETVAAWKVALENTEGPTAIVVTRQDLPILDRSVYPTASSLSRGAYVLSELGPEQAMPDVVLIGSGSEVSVAMSAADTLAAEGTRVRVVSMPSWELFAAQPLDYRDSVLPPEVAARISIEAALTFGWEKWVGAGGTSVGVDRFGASAPGPTVMTELGITPEHVAEAARSLLA
jgi:transketolase